MHDHVEDAVEDNIAWCDAVCRAAGLPTRWSADLWSADRRTPDGYPDAVTRQPGLDVARVLAAVEEGDGCSVKDSFADLDLAPAGFHVLFDATWIRRRASAGPPEPALRWAEVRTADELSRWCDRLAAPALPPALLDRPGVHVLEARQTGSGFVLTRTGTVVGVSNAAPGDVDPAVLWSEVVAVSARLHPGLDLVGYEAGDDLPPPLAVGFSPVGPLRVWLRRDPPATDAQEARGPAPGGR